MGILQHPHHVLGLKSNPIDFIDVVDRNLITRMFTLMYQSRGIALAAVQTGWPVRLFVLDIEDKQQVIVNPTITLSAERITSVESCLSVYGPPLKITRAKTIRLQAFDTNFKPIDCVLDGLMSRMVQHEVDHLDGILIVDKAQKKDRPFPWRCRTCAKREVRPAVVPYECLCNVDGVLHRVTIDALKIPVCGACGEKVFTVEVDEQVQAHLRMLDV